MVLYLLAKSEVGFNVGVVKVPLCVLVKVRNCGAESIAAWAFGKSLGCVIEMNSVMRPEYGVHQQWIIWNSFASSSQFKASYFWHWIWSMYEGFWLSDCLLNVSAQFLLLLGKAVPSHSMAKAGLGAIINHNWYLKLFHLPHFPSPGVKCGFMSNLFPCHALP